MRKFTYRLLFLILILMVFPAVSLLAAWREPVRARYAMVASKHVLTSEIGANVMKKGGNAVDAAVAVGLALAVVYPEARNLASATAVAVDSDGFRLGAIDSRSDGQAVGY